MTRRNPSRWHISTRKARLPKDWDSTRRPRILRRDKRRCQWPLPDGTVCGRRANQVDHKTPNDDHSDTNLWTLCIDHHTEKTQHEAAAARWQHRRTRTPEPHPGLTSP